MKSLINQETLICYLELTYSTICFDQTEGHALAITQFYKRQFLAGHSGRTPATTTRHDPQPTFMLREENSLEHNLNRSREVEPVEHTTMTKEQEICKQHVNSNTQPNKMMEDLLSDCQQRWIPSNLDLLVLLQSEDYIYMNIDWNKNSRISTTIS